MGLTEHTVRSRIGDRTSFSQPGDFVLDAGWSVDRARMHDPDVTPYCFDFEARRLFCVSTPAIGDATFFYQAQRQRARSVIKVPYDELPDAAASPALIFSIGRCGSTLLVKALAAASLRTASEPDYFTQAVMLGRRAPELQEAIGRATALLRVGVIKLRAECSNAPLLIAGAFRAPRLVFIVRDAVDWADSVRRVSSTPDPAGTAALLRGFLLGLETLVARFDVRICHYEDFRVPTASYVNALLRWLDVEGRIRPAAAALLAGRDAQEGSVVSRAAVGGAEDDPRFRAAFRDEWARARPAALIERLALRGM
jgi:hypothetical protein